MNREEINKLISDYESKWGKLGAGNSILNPEKTAISHSGIKGGKRKMLNMTNDYYEFRRKVAEGKNKNKLAHAATVNIDEINRQYWEKINTDGTLIHAGGRYVPDYEEDDDYLEHADRNVKYYQKLDLGNGNYRYFYTKEEWDAYQNAKHAENERKKQGSIGTEFKIKKSGEALGKAAKNAFGKLANANEYKKNEEYSKYAEEDRQTDMADERERKAVLKKFKKEMLPIPDDMGVEAKKLVDKYIETGDPDDLSALEKALSPELRGNLQGRLLSLQKESFMGNKIRKDGSLRKMSHSVEDDDDIDTGVMSEYRAFKARANRGAEMNRLTHSSFISPSELNERYEEEIASHCFLAHAGGYGPASGTNAYVAKIDNFYGQGKPRYFYSKEEWDAYQRNAKGASQAGADRASKETATGVRQNQINNAQNRIAENQRLESQRKNAEASQAGADRASKETAVGTRQNQISDAKKRIAENQRSESQRKNAEAAQNAEKEKASKETATGVRQNQISDAKKRVAENKLAEERAEISKKNDTGRDAAIKKSYQDEQDRREKEAKLDEARKTQKEAETSGNNRTQSDTSYNGEDLANALKRNTSKDKIDNLGTELGSILAEYYKVVDDNDDSDAGFKAKRKAWDEYFDKRDKIFEKYGIEFNSPEYAEAQKVVKEIEAEYGKSRNLKGKNLNFKHSALDELNEFKAKVAMGKEKNRLAHSRMISLTELQHAASSRYGAPSGTNKYYAKLDDFYGKGKTRYFYSKAEWDAYQNNMKGAQNADRQKNDQSYRDQNKSFEENRRKNEEAAIGREKEQQAQSYTVKKALEENRRKNEGYAQNAEKDRWANANSDTSTKPSEAVKDNKVANDTQKDDFFKKEHTDYVQKNGDRIINEYNKAAEDEHNVSLQIDEKYGFNKAKTDEELNKCWDNLVQDMYQTALTIDNPDHCYMNFFWHDENGNGSAGWDISIPEFEQWAQEYQKEIDEVFEKGRNATSFEESKAYGDQWEAMNEELRARNMEAKTKTLQMVTKLKKECLKK